MRCERRDESAISGPYAPSISTIYDAAKAFVSSVTRGMAKEFVTGQILEVNAGQLMT